jgi:hypothetical protein
MNEPFLSRARLTRGKPAGRIAAHAGSYKVSPMNLYSRRQGTERKQDVAHQINKSNSLREAQAKPWGTRAFLAGVAVLTLSWIAFLGWLFLKLTYLS